MLRTFALALGPLAALALGLFTPTLQASERWALAIVVWMALWWVSECVPVWCTALLPLASAPFAGCFAAELWPAPWALFRAYADTYLFLFLGGLCLAQALQECGLHRRFSLNILSWVGPTAPALIAGILLASAFVSMWISNTATAAMMLPIALSLVLELERRAPPGSQRRTSAALLLAVAYGANIGGLATKIGTAPNAQLAMFLERAGTPVNFLEFALIGSGLVLLLLPCALLCLWCYARRDGRAWQLSAEDLRQERQRLGPMHARERATLLIFVLTALAWILAVPLRDALQEQLPRVPWSSALVEASIAMLAAFVLLLLRIQGQALLPMAAWRRLSYSSLVLLGGGLALALLMSTSGLSTRLGAQLASLQDAPGWIQALCTAGLATGLSALASNTAVTGLLLPIVAAAAAPAHASALLFTTAFAASCDFALPVGTPPNALVFGTARVRVPVMLAVGLPLDLVSAALCALWCWYAVPWVLG